MTNLKRAARQARAKGKDRIDLWCLGASALALTLAWLGDALGSAAPFWVGAEAGGRAAIGACVALVLLACAYIVRLTAARPEISEADDA